MDRDDEEITYVKLETTYPHSLLRHLSKLTKGDVSVLKEAEDFQRRFQSRYPKETAELALLQAGYEHTLITDFFDQKNKSHLGKRVFLEMSLRALVKHLTERDAVILLESLMFLFGWNFSMEVKRTWEVQPGEQASFHEKTEIKKNQKMQNPQNHIHAKQQRETLQEEDYTSVDISSRNITENLVSYTPSPPSENQRDNSVPAQRRNETKNSLNTENLDHSNTDATAYRPLPKTQDQAKYFKQMNIRTRKTLKKALRNEAASQCEMGDYYAEPNTSHTDYAEALVWYQHSAQNGYQRALFEMCKIYDSKDIGIPGGKEESVRIYTDLANQKFPSAQYILGMKYWFGDGVENNVENAIKWLRLAAEQKHESAVRQLADIYSYLQNDNLAQYWYKKGAKMGDEYCRQRTST